MTSRVRDGRLHRPGLAPCQEVEGVGVPRRSPVAVRRGCRHGTSSPFPLGPRLFLSIRPGGSVGPSRDRAGSVTLGRTGGEVSVRETPTSVLPPSLTSVSGPRPKWVTLPSPFDELEWLGRSSRWSSPITSPIFLLLTLYHYYHYCS